MVKTVYEYFKTMAGADKFDPNKMPVTEYHLELKSVQESAPQKFIKFLAENREWILEKLDLGMETTLISFDPKQFFDVFNFFIGEYHLTFQTNPYDLLLKIRNLSPKIPEKALFKKKTNKGNLTTINLTELAKHYGFGLDCPAPVPTIAPTADSASAKQICA